jgi:hypothetical protein
MHARPVYQHPSSSTSWLGSACGDLTRALDQIAPATATAPVLIVPVCMWTHALSLFISLNSTSLSFHGETSFSEWLFICRLWYASFRRPARRPSLRLRLLEPPPFRDVASNSKHRPENRARLGWLTEPGVLAAGVTSIPWIDYVFDRDLFLKIIYSLYRVEPHKELWRDRRLRSHRWPRWSKKDMVFQSVYSCRSSCVRVVYMSSVGVCVRVWMDTTVVPRWEALKKSTGHTMIPFPLTIAWLIRTFFFLCMLSRLV